MTTRSKAGRWMWLIIICLIFLGSASTRVAAGATAVAVSRANSAVEIAAHAEYLLDDSGTLRYEDIVRGQLPFQRHTKNSFQFSFKNATLWIKCRVAAVADENIAVMNHRHSLLAFDNAALGSVTLWVPVAKNGRPDVIELRGGWQQNNQRQEFPFLNLTFVLPDNIDDSRPVIVRVATPFLLQFRATLYTIEAFQANSFILFLIVGVCAGILIAMLLYNFGLYLFTRDKHYIYYILYIFFLLLWQCTLSGLFQYVHPVVGTFMITYINVFALCMMLFATIFAIMFLDTVQTAPRHDALLKGLAVCMVILILMCFLTHLWIITPLAYLMGQLITVAVFTAAISSLRSGFRPAKYYLIAVSVLLCAAIIFLLKFYGLISNNKVTMHIVFFGSAVESILLSFALGYRIRIMREREKSLQAISVTDELTGLFNRRFLNRSLAKKMAEVRRSNTTLSLLMVDVDYFKNFNDTYGHLEGDQVLVFLGKMLTQTLREEDIACRYGGEEFVTILHNADKNAALEAAERIRSRFEQMAFTPGAGKTIHLTVSIGVAQWLRDESPEQFIFRADQAMYQAKQTGRNRICSA